MPTENFEEKIFNVVFGKPTPEQVSEIQELIITDDEAYQEYGRLMRVKTIATTEAAINSDYEEWLEDPEELEVMVRAEKMFGDEEKAEFIYTKMIILQKTGFNKKMGEKKRLKFKASEIIIIKHIMDGLGVKDIAKKRFISEATVNAHIKNISEKLGLEGTKEAIIDYMVA